MLCTSRAIAYRPVAYMVNIIINYVIIYLIIHKGQVGLFMH